MIAHADIGRSLRCGISTQAMSANGMVAVKMIGTMRYSMSASPFR
jgi:gamma-glutamyl phosphate reductase